jgi:hypothetical protein
MREERWALILAYLENVHGLDWSRPLVVQWWNHSRYLVWPRKASKIWVQIMKCCNHPKRPAPTVNCALPIYQLNKSSGRTGNVLQTILDVWARALLIGESVAWCTVTNFVDW